MRVKFYFFVISCSLFAICDDKEYEILHTKAKFTSKFIKRRDKLAFQKAFKAYKYPAIMAKM